MYNRRRKSKGNIKKAILGVLALLAVSLLGLFGWKTVTNQSSESQSVTAKSSVSQISSSSSTDKSKEKISSSSQSSTDKSSSKKSSQSSDKKDKSEESVTESSEEQAVTDIQAEAGTESESVADAVAVGGDISQEQVVAEGYYDSSYVGSELGTADTAYYDYSQNYQDSTVYYDNTYATSGYGSSVVLANGNTAGEIGSYAAAQMAAATGVPQETWEYIIARESNGDPSAANASGASGLFQTIPGWGSTATVEDQIQAALNAYNSQGLSAWGY